MDRSDGVRRRNVPDSNDESSVLGQLRRLDAFTKVTEEAEAPKTVQGGVCTAIALTVMAILLLSEMTIWVWYTNIKVVPAWGAPRDLPGTPWWSQTQQFNV